MGGFVEEVPQLTLDEACEKIGSVADELNRQGPWPPDLWLLISELSRARIRKANRSVDEAANKTGSELESALNEYRSAWFAALAEVQVPQPKTFK